uniref:Uncharacterized protein n=1 Tax=Oryza rufipogon TaxID=4529 RepID=A0A0E0QXH5_ORYRU
MILGTNTYPLRGTGHQILSAKHPPPQKQSAGLEAYSPIDLVELLSIRIASVISEFNYHHTNVPQYPQNTVYGYPPSTVTCQGGELGAQGFAKMTSSYSDNYIFTNFGSGDPTRTPLVWTQVGSIVFPVYAATPISSIPSSLVRDIDKLRECMMVRSSGSDDMDACRLERHLAGGWRHVVPKQERVRKNMFKVQPDTVTRMLVWFRPLSPLHRTNLNRRRTKIVSTRGWNS